MKIYILPMLAGYSVLWSFLYELQPELNLTGIDAAVTVFVLAAMVYVLDTILHFYKPPVHKIHILILWILVFGSAGAFLSHFVLKMAVKHQASYLTFLQSGLVVRLFVFNMMLLCFGLLMWIRRQNEDMNKTKQRFYEIKQMAREAELNNLRQQLQPHFLFNSLNSIHSLIGENDNAARKMIEQLGDFLRGSIRKQHEDSRTWEDELKHAALYLEIEKVRFSDRLNVETEIDDNVLQHQVPSQILQPLLENAIKYSIYESEGAAGISLHIKNEENYTTAEIVNSYDAETEQQGKGTGYGISSLKRRLALLYNREDLLETEAGQGRFTVKIRIPKSI